MHKSRFKKNKENIYKRIKIIILFGKEKQQMFGFLFEFF